MDPLKPKSKDRGREWHSKGGRIKSNQATEAIPSAYGTIPTGNYSGMMSSKGKVKPQNQKNEKKKQSADSIAAEMGDAIHKMYSTQLAMAGAITGAEATLVDKQNLLVGAVDAIAKDGTPIEIKTISIGELQSMEQPRVEHVAQLQYYIRTMGADKGLLVYIAREAPGQKKSFEIQANGRWNLSGDQALSYMVARRGGVDLAKFNYSLDKQIQGQRSNEFLISQFDRTVQEVQTHQKRLKAIREREDWQNTYRSLQAGLYEKSRGFSGFPQGGMGGALVGEAGWGSPWKGKKWLELYDASLGYAESWAPPGHKPSSRAEDIFAIDSTAVPGESKKKNWFFFASKEEIRAHRDTTAQSVFRDQHRGFMKRIPDAEVLANPSAFAKTHEAHQGTLYERVQKKTRYLQMLDEMLESESFPAKPYKHLSTFDESIVGGSQRYGHSSIPGFDTRLELDRRLAQRDLAGVNALIEEQQRALHQRGVERYARQMRAPRQAPLALPPKTNAPFVYEPPPPPPPSRWESVATGLSAERAERLRGRPVSLSSNKPFLTAPSIEERARLLGLRSPASRALPSPQGPEFIPPLRPAHWRTHVPPRPAVIDLEPQGIGPRGQERWAALSNRPALSSQTHILSPVSTMRGMTARMREVSALHKNYWATPLFARPLPENPSIHTGTSPLSHLLSKFPAPVSERPLYAKTLWPGPGIPVSRPAPTIQEPPKPTTRTIQVNEPIIRTPIIEAPVSSVQATVPVSERPALELPPIIANAPANPVSSIEPPLVASPPVIESNKSAPSPPPPKPVVSNTPTNPVSSTKASSVPAPQAIETNQPIAPVSSKRALYRPLHFGPNPNVTNPTYGPYKVAPIVLATAQIPPKPVEVPGPPTEIVPLKRSLDPRPLQKLTFVHPLGTNPNLIEPNASASGVLPGHHTEFLLDERGRPVLDANKRLQYTGRYVPSKPQPRGNIDHTRRPPFAKTPVIPESFVPPVGAGPDLEEASRVIYTARTELDTLYADRRQAQRDLRSAKKALSPFVNLAKQKGVALSVQYQGQVSEAVVQKKSSWLRKGVELVREEKALQEEIARLQSPGYQQRALEQWNRERTTFGSFHGKPTSSLLYRVTEIDEHGNPIEMTSGTRLSNSARRVARSQERLDALTARKKDLRRQLKEAIEAHKTVDQIHEELRLDALEKSQKRWQGRQERRLLGVRERALKHEHRVLRTGFIDYGRRFKGVAKGAAPPVPDYQRLYGAFSALSRKNTDVAPSLHRLAQIEQEASAIKAPFLGRLDRLALEEDALYRKRAAIARADFGSLNLAEMGEWRFLSRGQKAWAQRQALRREAYPLQKRLREAETALRQSDAYRKLNIHVDTVGESIATLRYHKDLFSEDFSSYAEQSTRKTKLRIREAPSRITQDAADTLFGSIHSRQNVLPGLRAAKRKAAAAMPSLEDYTSRIASNRAYDAQINPSLRFQRGGVPVRALSQLDFNLTKEVVIDASAALRTLLEVTQPMRVSGSVFDVAQADAKLTKEIDAHITKLKHKYPESAQVLQQVLDIDSPGPNVTIARQKALMFQSIESSIPGTHGQQINTFLGKSQTLNLKAERASAIEAPSPVRQPLSSGAFEKRAQTIKKLKGSTLPHSPVELNQQVRQVADQLKDKSLSREQRKTLESKLSALSEQFKNLREAQTNSPLSIARRLKERYPNPAEFISQLEIYLETKLLPKEQEKLISIFFPPHENTEGYFKTLHLQDKPTKLRTWERAVERSVKRRPPKTLKELIGLMQAGRGVSENPRYYEVNRAHSVHKSTRIQNYKEDKLFGKFKKTASAYDKEVRNQLKSFSQAIKKLEKQQELLAKQYDKMADKAGISDLRRQLKLLQDQIRPLSAEIRRIEAQLKSAGLGSLPDSRLAEIRKDLKKLMKEFEPKRKELEVLAKETATIEQNLKELLRERQFGRRIKRRVDTIRSTAQKKEAEIRAERFDPKAALSREVETGKTLDDALRARAEAKAKKSADRIARIQAKIKENEKALSQALYAHVDAQHADKVLVATTHPSNTIPKEIQKLQAQLQEVQAEKAALITDFNNQRTERRGAVAQASERLSQIEKAIEEKKAALQQLVEKERELLPDRIKSDRSELFQKDLDSYWSAMNRERQVLREAGGMSGREIDEKLWKSDGLRNWQGGAVKTEAGSVYGAVREEVGSRLFRRDMARAARQGLSKDAFLRQTNQEWYGAWAGLNKVLEEGTDPAARLDRQLTWEYSRASELENLVRSKNAEKILREGQWLGYNEEYLQKRIETMNEVPKGGRRKITQERWSLPDSDIASLPPRPPSRTVPKSPFENLKGPLTFFDIETSIPKGSGFTTPYVFEFASASLTGDQVEQLKSLQGLEDVHKTLRQQIAIGQHQEVTNLRSSVLAPSTVARIQKAQSLGELVDAGVMGEDARRFYTERFVQQRQAGAPFATVLDLVKADMQDVALSTIRDGQLVDKYADFHQATTLDQFIGSQRQMIQEIEQVAGRTSKSAWAGHNIGAFDIPKLLAHAEAMNTEVSNLRARAQGEFVDTLRSPLFKDFGQQLRQDLSHVGDLTYLGELLSGIEEGGKKGTLAGLERFSIAAGFVPQDVSKGGGGAHRALFDVVQENIPLVGYIQDYMSLPDDQRRERAQELLQRFREMGEGQEVAPIRELPSIDLKAASRDLHGPSPLSHVQKPVHLDIPTPQFVRETREALSQASDVIGAGAKKVGQLSHEMDRAVYNFFNEGFQKRLAPSHMKNPTLAMAGLAMGGLGLAAVSLGTSGTPPTQWRNPMRHSGPIMSGKDEAHVIPSEESASRVASRTAYTDFGSGYQGMVGSISALFRVARHSTKPGSQLRLPNPGKGVVQAPKERMLPELLEQPIARPKSTAYPDIRIQNPMPLEQAGAQAVQGIQEKKRKITFRRKWFSHAENAMEAHFRMGQGRIGHHRM